MKKLIIAIFFSFVSAPVWADSCARIFEDLAGQKACRNLNEAAKAIGNQPVFNEEFAEIFERARAGDAEALRMLRNLLMRMEEKACRLGACRES